MLDLNTTEARRKVFAPTLDWLNAGGHAAYDGVVLGFDMSEVILTTEDNDGDAPQDYNGNDCGTICCMLGHQQLVNGAIGEEVYKATHKIGAYPYFEELNDLFYPITHRTIGVRMAQISPAMAAATLERYIETGEVEWRIEDLV